MFQRDPATGYPVGADQHLRDSYGKIPGISMFQHPSNGYQQPTEILGWEWSNTFNRWGTFVKFNNGWIGYTYPAPSRKHHDDCPVCHAKLTYHSPNGFDKLFECNTVGHHRHLIRGITGEYMTLLPITPTSPIGKR